WRIFFIGLVLGAIGGAIAALLTAPRPGREVRGELAACARDAATDAREWVPVFPRGAAEAPPIAPPPDGEASPPPPPPHHSERSRCHIPSSPPPASFSPLGPVVPAGGWSPVRPRPSPWFVAELRVLAPARLDARLRGAGLAASAVSSAAAAFVRREAPCRDRAG